MNKTPQVGDRVNVTPREFGGRTSRRGTVVALNVQGAGKRIVRHTVKVDGDNKYMAAPFPLFAVRQEDMELAD